MSTAITEQEENAAEGKFTEGELSSISHRMVSRCSHTSSRHLLMLQASVIGGDINRLEHEYQQDS